MSLRTRAKRNEAIATVWDCFTRVAKNANTPAGITQAATLIQRHL